MRRRNFRLLMLVAALFLNLISPIYSFTKFYRHKQLYISGVVHSGAADKSNFGSKWDREVESMVQRKNTRRNKKRKQSSRAPPTNRHGAIQFNKMITQFLREDNGSPAEAEDLLLQKVEEEVAIKDYDTMSFNLILNAWARQRSTRSAKRADSLLQTLLSKPELQADGYSYSAVLNAYAKSGGKRQSALRAEELLNQMELTIPVTTNFCYNAVMDCWSVSGCEDAGRRAQRWLTRLEERGPEPSRISYNACMKAWARCRNGAAEAQKLLSRMKSIGGDVAPDKISYSTCIDAWCRSYTNHTEAAAFAEELLQEMESKGQNDTDIRPDVVAYTSVLSVYAKAGVDAPRAMNLVARMQKYSNEQPNTTFLNTLMHFFAKCKKVDHAETLLASMRNSDMADKITYTSLISAHANVGNATRARQLLDELQLRYEETREKRFLPTTKTFTSVLHALAKSKVSMESLELVNEAEEILSRLENLYKATHDPDLATNSVIYSQIFLILSMSKDSDAPLHAERLMQRMRMEQEAGNPWVSPDASTYAYMVNTFTKARAPDAAAKASKFLQEVEEGYKAGNDSLKPTKLLYSAVLQSFAKSASPEGAEKAEELLDRTKLLYKQGKIYAKPTTLYYNAVIDAQARSRRGRSAALRAEELLQELETKCRAGDSELRPTARSYNAAILAWKNSNATDAPQRAEALLKRMNERYRAGDDACRPDRVTINSIIAVWAKSKQENAPERAETYLKFLEDLYFQAGDSSLKPDKYSFNSVLYAYSSSSLEDAPSRAQALYDRMKELFEAGHNELEPDIITLTSLRNVWAKSSDPSSDVKLKRIGTLISRRRQSDRVARAVKAS